MIRGWIWYIAIDLLTKTTLEMEFSFLDLSFYFSSVIKEYSRGDARTREAGRILWYETVQKLRKLLDQYADLAIRDEQSRKNYFSSCKLPQVDYRILSKKNPKSNSITNLYFFLQPLSKNLINVSWITTTSRKTSSSSIETSRTCSVILETRQWPTTQI